MAKKQKDSGPALFDQFEMARLQPVPVPTPTGVQLDPSQLTFSERSDNAK